MLAKKWSAVAVSLALAAGSAWSGVAFAQDSDKAPGASELAPSYSSKELKSFAVALLSVRSINEDMLEKVARAKTPEEETIARSEARQEMVRTVQEKGLSVSKYNRISMEVRTNPELADKVMQYMERAR
jgi:hypothetical protein